MKLDPQTTLIVTDLDACLVNTWEMVQIFIWDYFNVWVPESECKQFKVSAAIFDYLKSQGAQVPHVAGLERRLVDGLWTVPHWYHEARPNYVYWQALLAWQAKCKHSIRYLTARPQNLDAVTRGWIQRWGLGANRGTLVLEDRSADKIQHLKRWAKKHPILYIDDKLDTVREADKIEGVEVVLFAHPWNQDSGSLIRWSEDAIAREIREGLE